ncbi:MAG: YceD family protein [Pseudomonadota bacterium]
MSRDFAATTGLVAATRASGPVNFTMPVCDLPRLAAQFDGGTDGRVAVALEASLITDTAGQEQRRLTGNASFAWATRCQRCLERMTVAVTAPIDVVVANDGVDDDGQPWDSWLDDPGLTLGDIIDEYALLALPLAPMHDYDCVSFASAEEPATEPSTRRPFAALEDLLRDATDDDASPTPPTGGKNTED